MTRKHIYILLQTLQVRPVVRLISRHILCQRLYVRSARLTSRQLLLRWTEHSAEQPIPNTRHPVHFLQRFE